MDILIKGVKMPKKGQYLQILIAENGEMSYEHVYYNHPSAGFKLHKSKAVALPPHGDLIDEDEFRLVIYREIRNHKEDEPITMILKGILWEIDNAPVIVEATE